MNKIVVTIDLNEGVDVVKAGLKVVSLIDFGTVGETLREGIDAHTGVDDAVKEIRVTS